MKNLGFLIFLSNEIFTTRGAERLWGRMMYMNFKKLLHSKWTSANPKNKEKHFNVIKVNRNSDDPQRIDSVIIEAIFTGRSFSLDPRRLKDREYWLEGWK